MNTLDLTEFLPQIMLWAAAIAAIAFIIDILLLQTEFISYIAVFILVVAGVLLIGMPLSMACVLIVLISLLAFYLVYLLWDKVLNGFFNKTLMKDVKEEAIKRIIGQQAQFRLIDGKAFISWNGELWNLSAESPCNFKDHENVIITGYKNGEMSISKQDKH